MELRNKHLWMEKHKLFVQSVNICNGLANYLLLDLYKWKQELENNSRYLCYNSYIQKGSPQFSPSPKQISPIFYSEELKENVFQNILVFKERNQIYFICTSDKGRSNPQMHSISANTHQNPIKVINNVYNPTDTQFNQ